jgi:Fe-S-cluster containining protein
MCVEEILKIRDAANTVLGKHCIEKCDAFCCKNYSLVLNQNEEKLFPEEKVKERMGGGFIVSIQGGCPNLNKDNTCTIYNQRPEVCRNAPFVFDKEEKMVKVGCNCSAITNGMLDHFFKQFEELGWKVFLTSEGVLGVYLKRWKEQQ